MKRGTDRSNLVQIGAVWCKLVQFGASWCNLLQFSLLSVAKTVKATFAQHLHLGAKIMDSHGFEGHLQMVQMCRQICFFELYLHITQMIAQICCFA